MKQIKVTFLFFCICILFLLHSCNRKQLEKKETNSINDSVNIFISKMKNENFDFKTRVNYANKVLQKIKVNTIDEKNIKILNYKVYLLGNLKQYDSVIYTLKKVLKKSIEQNDSTSIGRTYSKLSYYYHRNKQVDSAYYYYNLIKSEYLKYNDSITNGNNLLGMAIIESSIGDYNSSEYSSSLALKYLNNKSPNSSSSVYNNWAISSRKQGQFEDALIFYNKAVGLTSLKENKIIIKNNIANTYRDLGNYNRSIEILDSLKKDTIINPITKAKVIDNLAYSKWMAKKDENILPELEKALEIRLREKDSNGLIASYAHLSKYFEISNPKESLTYAFKMYKVATNQKSTQDQLEALQKLITLDHSSKIKGYYNSYVRINDSLQKAEQKAKNKFAKIKYNSEKNREENLQLRIDKTANLLEIEKKEKWNLTLFSLGGISFVIFFSVLYHRNKKHKLEKLKEAYKVETRIAKKLHDEVANDVVNIMNKIQYTDKTSEHLLDDLEKVYLLTRNISHENNTIETGVNFENFLKVMLTSFNNNQTTIIIKDIHKVGLSTIIKEKQIEIYRILQELMVNMRKHSNAKLVAISFKIEKSKCIIIYSDNGVGFNSEKLTLKSGLKNVGNRIKSIHGTINFETALNKGFKVFISFKK